MTNLTRKEIRIASLIAAGATPAGAAELVAQAAELRRLGLAK